MVEEDAIRAPSQQVTDMLAAIDRFRARPKRNGLPAELAAELRGIRHGQNLLELEFSETAAQFGKTEEYDEQGSVSPIYWIRHHCRMSSSAVWGSVAVGQHLGELSRSVEASKAVRSATPTWR